MNIIALKKLSALLREPLPKETYFDLHRFYVNDSCKTICCACGLAATNEWFIKRGFHLFCNSPCYGGHLGWFAAEKFFVIDLKSFKHLFAAESYRADIRDPITVADRIDAFVENDGITTSQ